MSRVLDISRSFPTTLQAYLTGAGNSSGDGNVTIYLVAFSSGGTLGYIDPKDNKVYMFTISVEVDSTTGMGKVGLITRDNNGLQINKAQFQGGVSFTIRDLLEMFVDNSKYIAQEAADGSRLDSSMVIANPDAAGVETYDAIPQRGGRRRKSRKSKKSKRHTRR